jgi:hypothetical protein
MFVRKERGLLPTLHTYVNEKKERKLGGRIPDIDKEDGMFSAFSSHKSC